MDTGKLSIANLKRLYLENFHRMTDPYHSFVIARLRANHCYCTAIRGRLFCGRAIRGTLRVIGSQIALRGEEKVASSLASSEKKAVYKSSRDLKSFVKWAMKHCLLKIRDMNEVQALPVAFQTSCIVGSTLGQMLIVPFSQRSEFLMLHAISAKDYLVPDNCQSLLLKLKEIVRKMAYEVIYGDERSVMIQTHSLDVSKALEIETQVQEEILRTYPLLWCCSFVRIYRCLLLLNDNRHTGLLYTPNKKSKFEVDLKHFSVDPCGEMPTVVSKTARACLLEILSEKPLRDKKYKVGKILRDVGSQLRDGALPFQELLISKTLTKNPEEYENSHGLHHVAVALRMNKSETLEKKLGKGYQVSYVFCKDGRPRHWSEMKITKDEETDVKADADYYSSQIIHPVVTEVCERIPGLGLDSGGVADALGLGAGVSSWSQA